MTFEEALAAPGRRAQTWGEEHEGQRVATIYRSPAAPSRHPLGGLACGDRGVASSRLSMAATRPRPTHVGGVGKNDRLIIRGGTIKKN